MSGMWIASNDLGGCVPVVAELAWMSTSSGRNGMHEGSITSR
jgi:hypothetical protein